MGTGLACAVVAVRFGPSPALPAFCYLAAIGVPLAMIDARCQVTHLGMPDFRPSAGRSSGAAGGP
jgi:hypothetical protein